MSLNCCPLCQISNLEYPIYATTLEVKSIMQYFKIDGSVPKDLSHFTKGHVGSVCMEPLFAG